MRGPLIALFLAVFCWSCTSATAPAGSMTSIVGDWRALYFPLRSSSYWNIRIEVENGQVTGKACLTSGAGASIPYDNLPVTVTARHPGASTIAFVDPSGHRWTGVLKEGTNLTIDGGGGRPLYKVGDYCASAR